MISYMHNAGETALSVADLLVRLDRPVLVEKQHPHRAMVVAPVVILVCPHG